MIYINRSFLRICDDAIIEMEHLQKFSNFGDLRVFTKIVEVTCTEQKSRHIYCQLTDASNIGDKRERLHEIVRRCRTKFCSVLRRMQVRLEKSSQYLSFDVARKRK